MSSARITMIDRVYIKEKFCTEYDHNAEKVTFGTFPVLLVAFSKF